MRHNNWSSSRIESHYTGVGWQRQLSVSGSLLVGKRLKYSIEAPLLGCWAVSPSGTHSPGNRWIRTTKNFRNPSYV
jgi:hypothetical protein